MHDQRKVGRNEDRKADRYEADSKHMHAVRPLHLRAYLRVSHEDASKERPAYGRCFVCLRPNTVVSKHQSDVTGEKVIASPRLRWQVFSLPHKVITGLELLEEEELAGVIAMRRVSGHQRCP